MARDAAVEVVARGFRWTEGPAWTNGGFPAAGDCVDASISARPSPHTAAGLLFSDVKDNVILKWNEQDGLSVFQRDAGCHADAAHCSAVRP